ncbi:hypothetical protein diail_5040 [Diaporthe ilicicola]|nr:hypothetical protein diail_5040 [Diaporthe ilicicola]
MVIPESRESQLGRVITRFQMEDLLLSFPNLENLENSEDSLVWSPFHRTPANAPPYYPNMSKFVLSAEQPGRLHHISAMLWEFPELEVLHYLRRTSELIGEDDPEFSNAHVFDAVHHCLRKLTYSSSLISHKPGEDDYLVEINCFEEKSSLDVPHFNEFSLLEELTIDQGLLGRMSTTRDRVDSSCGPYHPDLDWKLPQSLRRLTIQFVFDWPGLSSQLSNIALAKNRGQFPSLCEINIVIVRSGILTSSTGGWPPRIPLLPLAEDEVVVDQMLAESGITLSRSAADLFPVELEDYAEEPFPPGHPFVFQVRRRYLHQE